MMKRILMAVLTLATVPAFGQFATISAGPLSGPCAGGAPSLGVDSLNSIVYTCGTVHIWQAPAVTIAVLPAQTAVTAVTTAQAIGSVPLTAGFQNIAGRTLEICGAGIYTSPGTTAPTLTISLVYGALIPMSLTTAATSTTAMTNAPFNFCYTLTTATTGATGTLEAHGWMNVEISGNSPAAAIAYLDLNATTVGPIDLTAANTLTMRAAASLTMTSVQLRQLTVVALN